MRAIQIKALGGPEVLALTDLPTPGRVEHIKTPFVTIEPIAKSRPVVRLELFDGFLNFHQTADFGVLNLPVHDRSN